MGRKIAENFQKRFGDRITFRYPSKPLEGLERRQQNEKIFDAFKNVLSGILKREPTTNELFGVEDISGKKPS